MKSGRIWLTNSVFGFLAIAVAFILYEGVLRWTEIRFIIRAEMSSPYPRFYFKPDSISGFDIAENFTPADFKLTDYGISYKNWYQVWSNELGCFDDSYRSETGPIVLIGDSFTWGFVPFPETWGAILERETGRRVLKCGVGGYGTRQERIKLEKLLKKVENKPELILIGYFPENDVIDDYLFPGNTVVEGYLVPKIVLGNSITGSKRNWTEEEIAARIQQARPGEHARTFLGKVKYWLATRSILYGVLRRSRNLRLIVSKLGLAEPPYDAVPWVFAPPGKYPWLEGAWKEHFDNILDIHRLADEAGIKIMFILIPTREQIYEQFRPRGEEAFWDAPNKRLSQFFERHGIAYLDLLPEFQAYSKMPAKPGFLGEDLLYWRYDRHWNRAGNSLAGLLVAKYVLEHNLIATSDKGQRLSRIPDR